MFRFAQPDYLYFLFVIPIIWGIFVYGVYKNKLNLKSFGLLNVILPLAPDVSKYKSWIKFILYQLALIAVIVALAGPQFGAKLENVKKQGIEVMIALDVSNSMMANDIKPDRLSKAKQILSKVVDNMQDDKVGLIVFAGDAYVQLPITSDYGAAKMFLSSINPGIVPVQGTAIGAAINKAMTSFTQDEKSGKTIIVITDGENHEDDAVSAAKDAAKKGIKVNVIGIGSPEGAPIPVSETNPALRKDASGNVVVSKLDEKTSQEIAKAGDGLYVRADNSNRALRTLSEKLDKLKKSEIESKVYSEYNDQFQGLLWIALVLLLVDVFILDRKNPFLKRIKFFS